MLLSGYFCVDSNVNPRKHFIFSYVLISVKLGGVSKKKPWDFLTVFEGHRLNPNEFMNFEKVAVLYKKTAIRGPCAFVSNSLRLSKIPPTLTPFLYSNM